MKAFRRNILVLVYLLYSACITNSCSGDETRPMVLFKFRRVAAHYEAHMEKDYDIKSDPLNLYRSPGDRKALCDAVLDAKQFAIVDDRRKESFLNDLAKLHRPSVSGNSDIRVENCPISQRWGYRVVKCLLCVKLKRERWLVAFGRPNEFMYLLRQDEFLPPTNSRFMGLLEYSAVVTKENSSFLYFRHHFQRRKAKMESICDSSTEDRLRLCSVVFVALSGDEISPRNTVDIHKRCNHTVLKGGGKSLSSKAKILACTLVGEQSNSLLKDFFVLPDVVERDGAFVFLAEPNVKEERLPVLRFYARVVKATTLLTPLKPEERPSRRKNKRGKQKEQTELCKNRPAKNKFLISETTRKDDEDEMDTDSSVTPDSDEWRSGKSDTKTSGDEEGRPNEEEKENETDAGPSNLAPVDDDDEWRHERGSDSHRTSDEDEYIPRKRKKLSDISSSEFKFFADMDVPVVQEKFALPAKIIDHETESDGLSPIEDDGEGYEREPGPMNNSESEKESSKGKSSP